MKEEKLNNIERDYDKEPIVIDDYNYIFGVMYFIIFALIILYFYFINPFKYDDSISRSYHFNFVMFIVIIPGIVYYFQIKKAKRKIILTNKNIIFKEEDNAIENIDIKNIKFIKRTFNEFYIKNQNVGELEALLILMLTPVNLPIKLINKFFFHLFKDGVKSYRLFDSIIIFDNDDKFINILPTTSKEWEIINMFIKNRLNIDLENSDLFFKFNYGDEKGKIK